MLTFYEQLRISRSATVEEIRDALAQWRRDIGQQQPEGLRDANLRRLDEAEKVLLDPERRQKYDQQFPTTPNPLPVPQLRAAAQPVMLSTCPTCGTPVASGATHCPVCGHTFSLPAPAPSFNSSPTPTPAMAAGSGVPRIEEKVFQILGWTSRRGVIVAIEGPYNVAEPLNLKLVLIKCAAALVFIWYMYKFHPILSALIVVILLVACFFLAAQVIMFFSQMTMSVVGKERQIPVRDVRLRDDQAGEHHICFRGELWSGHINPGDEIEVWCRDRSGTLMARYGRNLRANTDIWVKFF